MVDTRFGNNESTPRDAILLAAKTDRTEIASLDLLRQAFSDLKSAGRKPEWAMALQASLHIVF